MEFKENGFFQAAQNVAKLGAYYTDLDHCRRIGELFDFDTAAEICVLEPCIGDGSGVLAVTGERPNCKIFGVEISKETYKEKLEGNEKFAAIIQADFLSGVKISRGAFSFCFANPPYGDAKEGRKRLEQLFVEKLTPYLKAGAYVALVIPYYIFKEEAFLRIVLARYDLKEFFRFDDKEYRKFKQVAIILQKKEAGKFGYLRSDYEGIRQRIFKIEDLPYLPTHPEKKYVIAESKDVDIQYTTLEFQELEAQRQIGKSSLLGEIGKRIFQNPYRGCDLTQPIVPVSQEISYLLSVIGGGQGLAGSEEEGTLHLQRGVTERVTEDLPIMDEKGKCQKITSSTYSQIHLNIIENNGIISQL